MYKKTNVVYIMILKNFFTDSSTMDFSWMYYGHLVCDIIWFSTFSTVYRPPYEQWGENPKDKVRTTVFCRDLIARPRERGEKESRVGFVVSSLKRYRTSSSSCHERLKREPLSRTFRRRIQPQPDLFLLTSTDREGGHWCVRRTKWILPHRLG